MIMSRKDKERYWNKVNKSGPFPPKYCKCKGRCWIWKAGCFKSGYGIIGIGYKLYYTHRVSWYLAYNSVPKDLCVLHKCDNPSCVNPEHLFLGTRTDNNRDKVRKGRQAKGKTSGRVTKPEKTARGENSGVSILTDLQVREIRASYKRHSYNRSNKASLAERYQVSVSCINHIIFRHNWKHLK